MVPICSLHPYPIILLSFFQTGCGLPWLWARSSSYSFLALRIAMLLDFVSQFLVLQPIIRVFGLLSYGMEVVSCSEQYTDFGTDLWKIVSSNSYWLLGCIRSSTWNNSCFQHSHVSSTSSQESTRLQGAVAWILFSTPHIAIIWWSLIEGGMHTATLY